MAFLRTKIDPGQTKAMLGEPEVETHMDQPTLTIEQGNEAVRVALARGSAFKQDLVKTKQVVSGYELAKSLGVSLKALQSDFTWLAVNVEEEPFYPSFLVNETLRLCLSEIKPTLATCGPWSCWRFLTTPSGFLGGRAPIELLRLGQVDRVKRAAIAHQER